MTKIRGGLFCKMMPAVFYRTSSGARVCGSNLDSILVKSENKFNIFKRSFHEVC